MTVSIVPSVMFLVAQLKGQLHVSQPLRLYDPYKPDFDKPGAPKVRRCVPCL